MSKPKDEIIERVIKKIKSRSEVGFEKYGVTLKEDYQPLGKWLTHIQEELMDAVNYIEKVKDVLDWIDE
jgi:Trm5-related predicted tRNA methylase